MPHEDQDAYGFVPLKTVSVSEPSYERFGRKAIALGAAALALAAGLSYKVLDFVPQATGNPSVVVVVEQMKGYLSQYL